MKLPALCLLLGLAGLTASLGAIAGARGSDPGRKQASYYANGQVESECDYEDGRREGACRRFHPDGSRMAEGSYAAGRMEGRWSFWRPDGSLDPARSGHYRAGERIAE